MSTQKNVFYNILFAVAQVLLPLITFPYLARTLGPTYLGSLNFAESFARYFVLLAAVGIPVYGVRMIAKNNHDKTALSKTFWEIFLINCIVTVGLSVVFIFSIFYIDKLAMDKALFTWSLLFFVCQVFLFEWLFAGMNQFKFIALRYFFIRLLFIVGVFYFIKNNTDYQKYMALQVVASLLVSLVNFNYLRQYISFDKNIFKQLNLRQHIKPLLILFLTLFSISVYLSLDTVLLGFLADNESVGYYSSVLKLNKIIIAVLAAISAAMFPKITSLYQSGEIEKFTEMIRKGFYFIISIGIPTMIVVFGCAPQIVFIVLGEGYERSILPLQITAPLILIVSLSSIFGFQILNALSRDKEILKSAIIGMVLSILLTFILVSKYKEIGEAITILITELSVCLAFIYFSKKHYNIKLLLPLILEQILACIPYIILIICIKILIANSYLQLIIISICSLGWFMLFHFVLLKNGLVKEQVLLFLKKGVKQAQV
jgi:O-antigen/teichoic acid export membrane protein